MQWLLVGAVAAVVFGPALLRTAAANPEALRRAADAAEKARQKAIDAAKEAGRAAEKAYKQYTAEKKMNGLAGTKHRRSRRSSRGVF